MLPRTAECLFLALTAALLIVLGTFGIFSAEASSFQIIISEGTGKNNIARRGWS